jgi:hypothetical protein
VSGKQEHMATSKGDKGAQGERGKPGKQGAVGARGPAGPVATRTQILEAVKSEFDTVRHELRLQLERMAQIQRQLDAIERILSTMISKRG